MEELTKKIEKVVAKIKDKTNNYKLLCLSFQEDMSKLEKNYLRYENYDFNVFIKNGWISDVELKTFIENNKMGDELFKNYKSIIKDLITRESKVELKEIEKEKEKIQKKWLLWTQLKKNIFHI